jgi:hypothetical protein
MTGQQGSVTFLLRDSKTTVVEFASGEWARVGTKGLARAFRETALAQTLQKSVTLKQIHGVADGYDDESTGRLSVLLTLDSKWEFTISYLTGDYVTRSLKATATNRNMSADFAAEYRAILDEEKAAATEQQ